MPDVRVHRIVDRSAVNGPGERCVIWVQGCTLRCRGCWNAHTWGARGGTVRSTDELLEHVRGRPDLDGVTLSGGEPFQQAAALVPFARSLHAYDLSVMAYTGYELDELVTPPQRELLGLLDIVVTGRYLEELRTFDAGWRGSSNQEVHWLTDTYARTVPEASVELHVGPDGRVVVTGFPPDGLLDALRR